MHHSLLLLLLLRANDTAQLALQHVRLSRRSQALVVAGESGSGKSAAARAALAYLAFRCQSQASGGAVCTDACVCAHAYALSRRA
jgi:ABC-type glutathione transport system ATPase component